MEFANRRRRHICLRGNLPRSLNRLLAVHTPRTCGPSFLDTRRGLRLDQAWQSPFKHVVIVVRDSEKLVVDVVVLPSDVFRTYGHTNSIDCVVSESPVSLLDVIIPWDSRSLLGFSV